MKTVKVALRPERVRTVPEQFSWVDQALVQHHLIDRCNSQSAALYLFLVTVADCEGLSYYASATLAGRLHLSEAQLVEARTQLMALDLIAWQAPLYQVLTLPTRRAPASSPATTQQAAIPASPLPLPTRPAQPHASARPALAPTSRVHASPLSLAQLLDLERRHAQL